MITGTALSPKQPTKPKIAAAKMPGSESGSVTLRKVRAGGAPSTQLAWISGRSMPASDIHIGKIMNGMYEVTSPTSTAKSL